MIDWGLLVAPAAVLLVIPLAIVSAQLLPAFRRSTGSILVSGALATIVFAAYWLIFGGVDSLNRNTPANGLSIYVGLLLTITTWILAINAAAQARRWLWVALIIASGYATFVAVYFSFTLLAFQNCFTGSEGNFTCLAPDPLRRATDRRVSRLPRRGAYLCCARARQAGQEIPRWPGRLVAAGRTCGRGAS